MGTNNCPGSSEIAAKTIPENFTALTLPEAAMRLRMCAKTLSSFLKVHPADPPLYARAGRQYLISTTDLGRMREVAA